MSYHTAYPNWDCQAVVCHLFLYLFICAPTTTFTWLSNLCTSQLSSIFYLSQEPLSCMVSFLKGTYNFQLFKKAICKGACTLKCTEKRYIPFAFLICPPHKIQGKPCRWPEECTVRYIFRNYPSVRLLFPSILSIPLGLGLTQTALIACISRDGQWMRESFLLTNSFQPSVLWYTEEN